MHLITNVTSSDIRRISKIIASQIYMVNFSEFHTCKKIYHSIPDPCIPETEKDRSTLDFPHEWISPTPSLRPDIFPEFDQLISPLPRPMPGDPEMPDDEEPKKKESQPETDDPDKDEETRKD